MPKITPFLWFHTQAETAAKFYVSIFKNSKIVSTSRYGDASALIELLGDPNPEKARRVTKAMRKMQKIDINGLKRAYAG